MIRDLTTGSVGKQLLQFSFPFMLSGPAGMGVWGYFWGNALAGFVSTIMGDFYYFTGLWKKRKLMIDR